MEASMTRIIRAGLFTLLTSVVVLLSVSRATAFIDGLTGTTFNFIADDGHLSTPDGGSPIFWGFGDAADGAPQYPGPTLIVNEGDTVTINLVNRLPEAVSMVFPGLGVTTRTAPVFTRGDKTLVKSLAPEALANGGFQRYVFKATKPGTYYYQSGSNQAVQLRMGLFGAVIVRPKGAVTSVGTTIPATLSCPPVGQKEGTQGVNVIATDAPACTKTFATFAYNPSGATDDSTAYDREYLFLVSEMDPGFQKWMEFDRPFGRAFDFAKWKANYWYMNGRAAPDTMGMPLLKKGGGMVTGSLQLPNQPYNCMPLFHPGERVLLRIINMGQDLHPLHTHGNHMRVVAEDGNLLRSPGGTGADLAREQFTVTLAPGKTLDAIFTWTGEKLGWDIYDHRDDVDFDPKCWTDPVLAANPITCPLGQVKGAEDYDINNNGIFEVMTMPNPYENLADHAKKFNAFPAPAVAPIPQSLPVFLPDVMLLTAGPQYSGSPFLGTAGALPPGEGGFNAFNGFFYMWHSHAERELTNNNIFPGGFLTMAGIVPWPMIVPGQPLPPDNLNVNDEFSGM